MSVLEGFDVACPFRAVELRAEDRPPLSVRLSFFAVLRGAISL
jgi:hypothetical protein